MLDIGIGPFATNKSLGIEDGVLGVRGQLVLGRITDQTFALGGKGHVRWSDSVTLIVGDNFHASIFENTDTRISGS